MKRCWTIIGMAAVLAANALGDEVKFAPTDKLPQGLNENIAAKIDPKGIVVSGAEGPLCTVWLAKSLALKPKFKPTLTVKYPLTPGQLAGALEVHSESFSDFRGQPVKPGVYTLRYGHQPQDGNHVGTSDTSDFFLAVPAANDADPEALKVKTLFKQSAKATGSNHPAIFSLLPAEEKVDSPALVHDAAREFWILALTASGKEGEADAPLPLRLVVIGKSEG